MLVRVSALATESTDAEDASSSVSFDAAPVSFPVSRQWSFHLRRGNPLSLDTSMFAETTLFLTEFHRQQEAEN
jgi:hypothetical protein